MKNQTKMPGAGSLNESPLMWLKIEGYHQNHSKVNSADQKERNTGFDHTQVLARFKRNGNDLLNHFINEVIVNTFKKDFTVKANAIFIATILVLMFVITGANAQQCSGTPAPGNTLATSTTICAGDSVTLSLQNPTLGAGVTYQWQESADGFTWTDIIGATNSTLTTYIWIYAEFERCLVTCPNSGLSALSNPIHIASGITAASISGTNVFCNGGNNGTATVTVSGGTGPVNYLWSNGQTSGTCTGLAAGAYTTIVTDANGCTIQSNSITITEPGPIIIWDSITSVSCNGGSNGAIQLNVTGITIPVEYLWSNGQTTQNVTGLAAGSYYVTVTDANGCTATKSMTLAEPSVIVTSTSVYSVPCNQLATATVTASGGVGLYSYDWGNGSTTATTTLTTTGTYPVTVTDANGCSVTATTIYTYVPNLSVSLVSTGCCINTTVVYGTPNFSYNWNGPNGFISTLSDPCNLANGIYVVTVTDAMGCTSSASIAVTGCDCITVCRDFNDNNAHGWAPDSVLSNVTVNVSNLGSQGGSSDYYIRAIDGSGASVLMTGPEFNTKWCCGEFCYDYKVIDDGFSTVQPINPRFRIQATVGGQIKMFQFVFNATVNENSGWQRFCAPVSGPECALPPVSSVGTWLAVASTVPPTLLSDWSSVVAGVQRISFPIDINGASGWETFGFDNVCFTPQTNQVNAGPDIIINAGQSVTLTAQGCSTTATWYTISGGLITPLGAGSTWTVTPTSSTCYVVECGDPLCCGSSDTVCVTVINLPVVHFFDGCDSTLCLNVTGGTPPYSYNWLNTNNQTICSNTIPPCTNVQVTVTDANGSAVTVTHKKALITGTVTNSTCNPGNGGVVFDVTCVDATCLPLTYAWRKNGNTANVIATTKNLTGATAGTYCVTATDACGNEYYCCYDIKCVCTWEGCIKFNTANASLSVTNFSAPASGCSFTYLWKTNTGFTHTGQTWNNVPAFTNVTLKIVSCCGDTVTKSYKPLYNLVLTKTDPCCTDSDGVITVSNVMGGSQPCTGYTFQWQKANAQGGPWATISGATSSPLLNCKAGQWYRVIVRDCCGNSITAAPIKMGNKVPFAISKINSVASDCNNLLNVYNGSIRFKVSTSCAPVSFGYSYLPFANCSCLPNGISYAQQPLPLVNNVATFNELAPGIYIFFIYRCNVLYQYTDTVHFKEPTFKFRFTNCGSNVCIVDSVCCGATYLWSNGSTVKCLNNLTPGATYTATVTNCEGRKVTRKIKVPKLTAQVTNANCGAANGSIKLTITGVINSNIITSGPRSPGQHCIKLFNMQGDLWECCYTITASPAVSFVIAKSACRSNCITVLTGTPPYTYEWKACSTGIITSVSNCLDLCGCYNVKVTDKNGCTATITYNISGVKINSSDTCGLCADMCGICTPNSFIWSNGATSQCIKCLSTGTYTVTVTDCNGVTYSCSQSITVNPLSAQLMNVQQPSGFIDIKVSGGCLPYTCHYSLNNVSPSAQPPLGTTNPFTFQIPNNTPNDWYTVTVNDACGSTVSSFQFFARNAQNGFEQSNTLPIPMVLPNPNNGYFNIQFTDAWQNVSVNYQVIDMSGKLMLEGKIAVDGSLLFPIDLSTKPKGLYVIHYNALSKSWTDKIVIQ
jgi:hypothetical protein